MNFTIVIPFYDGHSTINRLIESIPETIEIVVVDDHSPQPLQFLNYPNIKILRGKTKGYFAGAVNIGISNTRGDVLILNQDIYFTGNGWLKQLQAALEEGYSYIGERIQGTRKDWPFGYIHGTYMYLTRELIDKTGLLNQRDFPMWGCTAEYQLRAARNEFKILPLQHVDDFVHIRPEGEQFGESFKKLVSEESHNRSLFVSTPPLVSIIIPVHGEKYAKFLPSTVNSLVGGPTDMGHWVQQTLGAFEVIIVDDSSDDGTPDIIKDVINPWKGVRSIRLNRPRREVIDNTTGKYIGKVVTLNAGIKAAYGKVILTLDADDMMKHDRVERMYRTQQQHPHGFVYDNFQFIGQGRILDFTYPKNAVRILPGGKPEHYPHPRAGAKTKFPKLQKYNFETLIYKNHVHNSIMFPKTAWAEIGGYPTRFRYGREDWAIAVKLGVHGYCGQWLSDYHGLLYRREGQNRTLENTKPQWMNLFRKQIGSEFKNIFDGERPMGCCGSGAKKGSKNQAFAPGQAGLEYADGDTVTIEYTGPRVSGAFNEYGFSTMTQYRVKPKKNFTAYSADLYDNTKHNRGLLELMEGGRMKYKIVPIVEEPVPEAAPEAEAAIEAAPPEVEVVQEQEAEIFDTSILNGTVEVVKAALAENGYTELELELLLAFERANKNRKTVIAAIEERL